MTFDDDLQDAKHMVTHMIPDLSIGMLQKMPTDAVVVCWHNCFHTAIFSWGDRQHDVIPTLGLLCCASRCQMPDPTAICHLLLLCMSG